MTTYPSGSWNLRVGRRPERVAAEVARLLDEHDVLVLAVQEASAYIRALRRHPWIHRHYRVRTGRPGTTGANSALIVRRGLKQSPRTHVKRLGGIRWERKPGRVGLHPARKVVWIGLGPRGNRTRVGSMHMPPGPYGARFPRRRRAKQTGLDVMAKMLRRWNEHGRRWAWPGDQNSDKHDAEIRDFLARVDGTATGNGIDYVIAHGVEVKDYRRLDRDEFPHRSDHNPVLFDLIVPDRKPRRRHQRG